MGNIFLKSLAFEGVAQTFIEKARQLNSTIDNGAEFAEIWRVWLSFYEQYTSLMDNAMAVKDACRDCVFMAHQVEDVNAQYGG